MTIDRSFPPTINEIDNFSLPTPNKLILNNGVPVFCFNNPNIDLIYIMLQIKTGSLYQNEKHLCQFSYMLLRESSEKHSPSEIDEKLDYYGTNITTTVGIEKVQILISVPKRNIDKILPIIADFICFPHFREESLKLYKSKEIKNLAYNEQKTDFLAWRLLWKTMLGPTFPKIFEFSTSETINSVTVQKLTEFHKQSFTAENTTLFLTGNIDKDTESVIVRNFEKIPHGQKSPVLPEIIENSESNLIYHKFDGCLQSSIILSSPSIGYNHPDRAKFSVLNTVAGGYFGSRLMQKLREEKGFTYGISSSSVYFANNSIFAINSDVNADNTNAAIDCCFEELFRLQTEPLQDEELETVKKYMIGIQLRSIDTSINAMQKFAYFYNFGLNESELNNYLIDIKNVTSEDIIILAKKYFKENKFIKIIVGKYCE